MTIVVDETSRYEDSQIKPAARRYGRLWCHLFDTDNDVEALCRFATTKLGMRADWLQFSANGIFPHFDLTPQKRLRAILSGAMPITNRRAAEISAEQVRTGRQFAQSDPRYGKRIMAVRRTR